MGKLYLLKQNLAGSKGVYPCICWGVLWVY